MHSGKQESLTTTTTPKKLTHLAVALLTFRKERGGRVDGSGHKVMEKDVTHAGGKERITF